MVFFLPIIFKSFDFSSFIIFYLSGISFRFVLQCLNIFICKKIDCNFTLFTVGQFSESRSHRSRRFRQDIFSVKEKRVEQRRFTCFYCTDDTYFKKSFRIFIVVGFDFFNTYKPVVLKSKRNSVAEFIVIGVSSRKFVKLFSQSADLI